MTEQILRPDGERYTFETLAYAPSDVIETVLRRGTMPSVADIVGWEFRGWNHSDFTVLAGIRKFKKGFYEPEKLGEQKRGLIRGYNVGIRPNANVKEPWGVVERKGEVVRFGFYEVYPARPEEPDYRYPNALLLNYDCDKNFKLDPTRVLRDYVSQVYADDPDLFVGKAFFALGPFRLFVSYMVLARENRSTLAP